MSCRSLPRDSSAILPRKHTDAGSQTSSPAPCQLTHTRNAPSRLSMRSAEPASSTHACSREPPVCAKAGWLRARGHAGTGSVPAAVHRAWWLAQPAPLCPGLGVGLIPKRLANLVEKRARLACFPHMAARRSPVTSHTHHADCSSRRFTARSWAQMRAAGAGRACRRAARGVHGYCQDPPACSCSSDSIVNAPHPRYREPAGFPLTLHRVLL